MMENTNKDRRTVRVINHQTIDGTTDVIEEIGYGSCREKNGKYYIIYTAINDGTESRVIVTADNNSVKIKRNGSDMLYIPGRITPLIYRTPYGTIDMEIKTEKIQNELSSDRGKLSLVYALTMQGTDTYNDTEIIIE